MGLRTGRLQFSGNSRRNAFLAVLPFLFVLTGCPLQDSGQESGTTVVSNPSTIAQPLTTPADTVCNPFNTDTTDINHGVIGNLLYLTDDQPRYTDVGDYITNGTPIQSTLYFSQLYIPTRPFDEGFYTQDNQLVLNADGNPLYEYFALRLETQLSLSTGQQPGWYQLAVLSDDGTIVSQKNADGSLTTIVDNDGTHPTQMGCANNAVYLDGTHNIPLVIEYYQGPRYYISLVMLWRPLPTGADPSAPVSDTQCGQAGNSMYFSDPATPTETYYDLLSRGWGPLEPGNYTFPVQATNPCGATDPLLISNFSISATARTSVTISWVTSLPSSTQGQVTNVTTSQTISSPLSSTLVTNHSVTITGLTANTLYSVTGLSTSADSQTATSVGLAFRTPR
jgi:hypothetical protein